MPQQPPLDEDALLSDIDFSLDEKQTSTSFPNTPDGTGDESLISTEEDQPESQALESENDTKTNPNLERYKKLTTRLEFFKTELSKSEETYEKNCDKATKSGLNDEILDKLYEYSTQEDFLKKIITKTEKELHDLIPKLNQPV